MYSHHQIQRRISVVVVALLIAMLTVSLLSPMARASSIIGVQSNIADVPSGADLVVTVTAQNDGDVAELEVDTSLPSLLPDFSVYANEADPYGGDSAQFAANGVTVTYSAAQSKWVIDFGSTVTDIIRNNGGKINFYFVLKDASKNILWGSMNLPSPESTFSFDVVAGTGDSLAPTPANNDTVIPGVPNTSVVKYLVFRNITQSKSW